MIIKFLKDTQDIRPGRTKYYKKDARRGMDFDLGNEYIKMGAAVRVDKEVKPKKVKDNG